MTRAYAVQWYLLLHQEEELLGRRWDKLDQSALLLPGESGQVRCTNLVLGEFEQGFPPPPTFNGFSKLNQRE